MPSKLTNHMRPFSHLPSETCMIPGSSWSVTACPTRIALKNLGAGGEKILFSVQVEGPVEGFTLVQDLERDFVRIFGVAQEGYFSYRLYVEEDALMLLLERCPETGLEFSFQGKKKRLKRKETYAFPLPHEIFSHPREKMHFGCHKKQDWTLVKRRLSLQEILPIWFALGKKCPETPLHTEGVAQLLQVCESKIEKQDRVSIGSAFLKLFQVGFKGMLTPRLFDDDYQGILEGPSHPNDSPLILLSEGAKLIRSLFIEKQGDQLSILPCLPVELHAGSCSNMQISETLSLDIEWSKKMTRRLILRPDTDQSCHLNLQKGLTSFRLKRAKEKIGTRIQRGKELHLEGGNTYLLDRFEK